MCSLSRLIVILWLYFRRPGSFGLKGFSSCVIFECTSMLLSLSLCPIIPFSSCSGLGNNCTPWFSNTLNYCNELLFLCSSPYKILPTLCVRKIPLLKFHFPILIFFLTDKSQWAPVFKSCHAKNFPFSHSLLLY